MESNINSIFLVDDDQDDKYFFHTALQEVNEDVQLFTACNGVDALDKLKFVKPDLILLDLVMPRMNGVVFLKMLKRNKDLCHVPVVIYTSDLSIFQENELYSLGASQIFIKPNDFQGTVKVIEQILEINLYKATA